MTLINFVAAEGRLNQVAPISGLEKVNSFNYYVDILCKAFGIKANRRA